LRDSARLNLGNPIRRAWEAHILYGSSTDATQQQRQRSRNPEGCLLAGAFLILLDALILSKLICSLRTISARISL